MPVYHGMFTPAAAALGMVIVDTLPVDHVEGGAGCLWCLLNG
jgi:hypothetical protein